MAIPLKALLLQTQIGPVGHPDSKLTLNQRGNDVSHDMIKQR